VCERLAVPRRRGRNAVHASDERAVAKNRFANALRLGHRATPISARRRPAKRSYSTSAPGESPAAVADRHELTHDVFPKRIRCK